MTKNFPSFNVKDYSGKELDNSKFIGNKTIVVMGHIECPPMALALKDLESYHRNFDTSGVQVMAFLENTEKHIDQFYEDSASVWGLFRRNFKIDTITYPMIAECKCEKKAKKNKEGYLEIGNHCRKLSWRIWTFSSPTFILVNSEGKILKKKKAYPFTGDEAYRINWLNSFINN
mgnify:CR=1 FL=1|jgi:glutathione peroxidase-family protein|tara:strand:- start:54 stop:575 length:522 start_codon:yes stop_codon:yes gene_type:complete